MTYKEFINDTLRMQRELLQHARQQLMYHEEQTEDVQMMFFYKGYIEGLSQSINSLEAVKIFVR